MIFNEKLNLKYSRIAVIAVIASGQQGELQ